MQQHLAWHACIAIMVQVSTFLQLPLKAVSLTIGLCCMFRMLDLRIVIGTVLTKDACRSRAEGMWSSSAPLMPILTLGLDPNARARLI